jgi:hypothetical protein
MGIHTGVSHALLHYFILLLYIFVHLFLKEVQRAMNAVCVYIQAGFLIKFNVQIINTQETYNCQHNLIKKKYIYIYICVY